MCLLGNRKIITKGNLLLDIENPSNMYQSPNNILGEVLGGLRYQETYQKAHAKYTGDLLLLLIPIYLWCYATHIDTARLFQLEPWSFGSLTFNEKNIAMKNFGACLIMSNI